jgi:hypothetical protein
MKLLNKFRLKKEDIKTQKEKDEKHYYDISGGIDGFLNEYNEFHPDF